MPPSSSRRPSDLAGRSPCPRKSGEHCTRSARRTDRNSCEQEGHVRDLTSLALRTEGGRVLVLDQTRLPDLEAWLDGTVPLAMVEHIRRLSVRGAPLIGVAAALSLAAYAEQGTS